MNLYYKMFKKFCSFKGCLKIKSYVIYDKLLDSPFTFPCIPL